MGDTAADVQRRRQEREQREREEAEKQQKGEREREEARKAETPQSSEKAVIEKRPRTERSVGEMDTEGGEASTSQSQPKHKKGHMTNLSLTDSDEVAIVDFVKNRQKLYNKYNRHFKGKARKNCLWRGLQAATTCQKKYARLGMTLKRLAMENSPSLARLPKMTER